MISKHYSIFCDECTRTINLFGQSIKECEDESRNMGWEKEPGRGSKHWYCPDCARQKAQALANTPETAQEPS